MATESIEMVAVSRVQLVVKITEKYRGRILAAIDFSLATAERVKVRDKAEWHNSYDLPQAIRLLLAEQEQEIVEVLNGEPELLIEEAADGEGGQ